MNSGKIFYTEDIKRNGSAVEFRDAQTGGVTTLQNCEIVQINKEAYETVVIQAQEVLSRQIRTLKCVSYVPRDGRLPLKFNRTRVSSDFQKLAVR